MNGEGWWTEKEGGGMNKPEKDRCWFRGGRGTLVLLLSSLSLALYSASVPGKGVQGGCEVTQDRHSPPWGEEGTRQDKCHKIQQGDRERKQEKILDGFQQTRLGSKEAQTNLGAAFPSPKLIS